MRVSDLKVLDANANGAFSLLEWAAAESAGKGSFAGTSFAHQTKLSEREGATKILKHFRASALKNGIVDVGGGPLTVHLIQKGVTRRQSNSK
jgi:hypothetical protein